LLVVNLRGSLVLLVLALAGGPLLATVTNGFRLFMFRRPWLRPAWSEVRRGASGELLRSGFLFLVLQVAMAVSYSSDSVVIAQILGPEAVTQYSVPAKLFGLINTLTAIVTAPLWPAYAEALVKRDNVWIRKTLSKSLFLLITAAIGMGIVLAVFGRGIIEMWVGPKVHPSTLLLASLGVWSVITAASVPLAMLLNAANVIKFQVIVAIVASGLNISLSIFMTHRLGVAGVVLGSIVAQTIAVLIPYVLFLRRFLRSLPTEPLVNENYAGGHPVGASH
jgi:O-antigen/teichoic acid export membrane protein